MGRQSLFSPSIQMYSFVLVFVLLPRFSPDVPQLVNAASNAGNVVGPSIVPTVAPSNSSSNLSTQSNGNLTLSSPSEKNTTHYYKPLYEPHYNSTPKFQNVTGKSVNPVIVALQGANSPVAPQPVTSSRRSSLLKRDLPTGTCAPGTPCVNGACCSNVSYYTKAKHPSLNFHKTGICGYSPDQCGTDVCISNCDAKAECGQYGVAGSNVCPLNVCCSEFGFCGSTDVS